MLLRYVLVGAAAFVLDYAVYWTLWRAGNIDYLLANAAGMTAGFVFSFMLNRQYTFAPTVASSSATSMGGSLLRFAAANLLSLVLASVVLFWLVQGMDLRADWAKFGVAALVPCWNFWLYRYFVFAPCR